MRRVIDFLRRNWALRLGAILLATVLYTGLVLGQNVRTFAGDVPIDVIRPPAGATVLNTIDPVKLIRFRAPLDVGVLSPSSFRAWIDLTGVQAQPGGAPVAVPVNVIALNQRVQIVGFEPLEVSVQLDPVGEREMPVTVTLGTVPESVTVGPPQVDPQTVTLRGASSRVAAVNTVVARVSIDASALNVDRDVDLVALDANGNEVPNVEIDPQRVRVRIAVARELANVTLPVVPVLTGQPAFGYRVSTVTVEPLVVTVSGEQATVARLDSAPTLAISVEGRTTDLQANIALDLPAGVNVNGSDQIKVMLTITQVTGSETFPVAINIVGARPGITYTTASALPDGMRADVTLAGPVLLLDQVSTATLSATVDVSSLSTGATAELPVTLTPPDGLALVDITPASLVFTAAAAPSPSASP